MFTNSPSLIPKPVLNIGRFEKSQVMCSYDESLQFGIFLLNTNEKTTLGSTTYVYDLKKKQLLDWSITNIGQTYHNDGLIVSVIYNIDAKNVISKLCNEAFIWEKTLTNNIIIYI